MEFAEGVVALQPRTPSEQSRKPPVRVPGNPPYDDVQFLVVNLVTWPMPDEGKGFHERDSSDEYTFLGGSCVAVPGEPNKAITARHNILGSGQGKVYNDEGQLEFGPVAKAAVWAVAIEARRLATLPDDYAEGAPEDVLERLLVHGGKRATGYQVVCEDEAVWRGTDLPDETDSELCILHFQWNLVGPTPAVTVPPASLRGKGEVEMLQIGFPRNYLKDPVPPANRQPLAQRSRVGFGKLGALLKRQPAQPAGPQPVKNLVFGDVDILRQCHSKFLFKRDGFPAGQELTLTLPSSVADGDSGGGVYALIPDPQLKGKHPSAYLIGSISNAHIVYGMLLPSKR